MAKKTWTAGIEAGDQITLELELNGNEIVSSRWNIIGRLPLLEMARSLSLTGDVNDLHIPKGRTPEALLLKELFLKVKGLWPQDPADPELCHCRKIPQSSVERSVILGAHSVEKVRRRCSANTGCGTCLPDVEDILKRYLA